MNTPGDERVQVIDRSVDLLEALAGGPMSLTDVCRVTGLSKATAFRLLAGLGHRGMIVKSPVDTSYMLGPALLRLVQGALSGIGAVAMLGRAALKDLSDTTQETVALHVQTGIERVCLDEVPSPQVIKYTSSLGSSAPLHVGSAGKVLLAFTEAQAQSRTLTMLADAHAELDVSALAATLRRVARDGWAISTGERVQGASAISVPIRSALVLFSLSVLGPTPRLPRSRLLEMLPAVQESAEQIEAALNAGTAPVPEFAR
jgi:DNA-binding IclR family transcriptional regulator